MQFQKVIEVESVRFFFHAIIVWLAQLVKSFAAPTHVHSCVQGILVQSPEQAISTQDSIPPG